MSLLLLFKKRYRVVNGVSAGGIAVGKDSPSRIIRASFVSGGVNGGDAVGGISADILRMASRVTGGGSSAGLDTPIAVALTTSTGGGTVAGRGSAAVTFAPVAPTDLGGAGVGLGRSPAYTVTASLGAAGGVQDGGSSPNVGRTQTMAPSGGTAGGGTIAPPTYRAGASPQGGAATGGAASSIVAAMAAMPAASVVGGDTISGNTSIVRYTQGGVTWNVGRILSSATSADILGGAAVGGFLVGQVSYTQGSQSWTAGTAYHRGPTNQLEILNAIVARLIATNIYTSSCAWVNIDGNQETDSPPGESFAVIYPGRKDVVDSERTGGGLKCERFTELVEMRVYSRLGVDRVSSRFAWSTDRTRGAYQRARVAAAVLDMLDLRDNTGTVIVAEPIRVRQIGDPKNSQSMTGWGFVPVYIEVSYTSDTESLTQ